MIFDIKSTALVLEGGAMRSVFTAGVLDFFMDKGLEFPYTIGVSGGASNGLSYLSKQRGRSHYANITLMQERPYVGLGTLIRTGRIIDMKFLFNELAFKLHPFDFDTYFRNPAISEMVTTNCVTGDAHYLSEGSDADRLLKIAHASCSLPIVSPMVEVDGEMMTDGGLVDSIPVVRALGSGYSHAVVVLTQNEGYRKSASRFKLPPFVLSEYPRVKDLLFSRAGRYNNQLALVEQLESEGRVTVFRPRKPLKVGRFTTNINYLQELYDEGYEIAEEWFCGLDIAQK